MTLLAAGAGRQAVDRNEIVEERVAIPASGGRALPGVLFYPEDGPVSARLLVCSPHPFLGGTSDNPVARAIALGAASAGAAALTWEYRCLADELPPEKLAAAREAFWRDHRVDVDSSDDLRDARTALDWLRAAPLGASAAEAPTFVAGYSYGAALALLLAGRETPAFVASPPLRALPEGWRLENRSVAALVAEDDLAVSPEEIAALDARSPVPLSPRRLPGDHFFREAVDDIADTARAWILARSAAAAARAPLETNRS